MLYILYICVFFSKLNSAINTYIEYVKDNAQAKIHPDTEVRYDFDEQL